MANPDNAALVHDLAEAASCFAQAAVNTMALPAKFRLADLIATRDVSLEVRVTLDPFVARVFVVPTNGGDPVEVGALQTLDDSNGEAQH